MARDHLNAHVNLAGLASMTGNRDEALGHYRRALLLARAAGKQTLVDQLEAQRRLLIDPAQ